MAGLVGWSAGRPVGPSGHQWQRSPSASMTKLGIFLHFNLFLINTEQHNAGKQNTQQQSDCVLYAPAVNTQRQVGKQQ